MAEFNFSFWSKEVGDQVHVNVILPIGTGYEDGVQAGEKFETLWLLHGAGGNATEWGRNTDIERLAINHRLAVVMPEIWGNFYANIEQGPQYYTFISEELPAFLRKYFPLSDKPEENYIAGLSMGGYGTAKCVFHHPERYGACGIFSSGPFTFGVGNTIPERMRPHLENIFGDLSKLPGSDNDVLYVLRKAVESGKKLPPIFNCCGLEDPSYAMYDAFRELADELHLDVTWFEDHGRHNWNFWAVALHRFMDWLPLKHRDFQEEYFYGKAGK